MRELGVKSNEGDFIYVNTQLLDPKSEFAGFTPEVHFSTIAHEFQHLLYFYRSLEKGWADKSYYLSIDDTWINEGMSTYAEQIKGDGSDIRVSISGGPAIEHPIGVFIYRY